MSATNDLNRIGPRTRFETATINKVGAGWDTGQAVERRDSALNLAFEPVPLVPIEARPLPLPEEAELRDQLRQALEREAGAHAALVEAEAAHRRARERLSAGRSQLEEYAGLDNEIAATLADSLRKGTTVAPDLTDALTERMQARAGAESMLRASVLAAERLGQELVAAAETATTAERTVALAVAALQNLEAARLAEEHGRLLRQAKAITRTLHGYDRAVTPLRVTEPPSVLAILRSDGNFVRGYDPGTWRELGARLRENPDAELTIALPSSD